MLEEEKWTTPSMTYFRPHFMMAPAGQAAEAHAPEPNGASASAYEKLQRGHTSQPWWLNYDQALDLQAPQQNSVKQPPPQVQRQAQPAQVQVQHKTIKHEQVEQARYGFDQVNYSGGQPSSIKPQKTENGGDAKRFGCDECSYVATQRSSLQRHKQTQHQGIKPQPVHSGKTYDCDVCPYQATQLSSLKRHKMAKHSGAQYPCDGCDYMGTTSMNLKLHKKSKHEGIRYPCEICGYEATQPGVLNRHKEQKHGMQRNIVERNYNSNNYNGGAQKALKDPNAPKRPLSGFFHFSNVGRAKIKASNPDFTVADISKELSRRWHALDEVTKSMFEQMAENDKARFREEKAAYNMTPRGGYKQTRAKKDPNAPKRPLCGFMMFSSEERAKVRQLMPNAGVGELGKELGKRWAEASPEIRAKYNAMAGLDKERFVREKNEYQLAPRMGQWRGARAKKDPNAPKRNVPGFMWFSNDERGQIRAENPGMRVGDCAKELSRRWALADPETRARYDAMAQQDKQRYEREKHEFHMKQRQKELDRPPQEFQQPQNSTNPSPSQQSWSSQGSNNVSNVPISPPITQVHATSPPLNINSHINPAAPAVRYGY